MNPLKEQVKLNRDIINKASDELGIPEEKIPVLVEKMLKNEKSRELLFKALGEFVGRRAFLGSMAGFGAVALGMGIAGAKTVISDNNVIIDDQWYLKVPAPFSALVGIDGSKVIAYDWKGKEIASGVAVVDDASVIQSAVNDIGEGKIFIRKGTYVIDQKITCPAGVFFEGEGTVIDTTSLDDVCFAWNENSGGTYYSNMLSGLRGFIFKGISSGTSPVKPNSQVAYFENLVRSVIVKDVVFEGFAKGIEVAGNSFDAHLENINARYSQNLVTLSTLIYDTVEYKPNQTKIIGCELSNSWSDVLTGSGIYIDTNIEGIKISKCWIEALTTGVDDRGKRTIVSENTIYATQYDILTSATEPNYTNNTFVLYDNGIGIALNSPYEYVTILGNKFKAYNVNETYAIKNLNSGGGVYVVVVGNEAIFSTIGTRASFYYGRHEYSVISNNKIFHTGSNDIYIIHSVGSTYSVIDANQIYTPVYGINAGLKTLVQGNVISGGATVDYNIDELTTYCDQHLYTVLPDTTDTYVSQLFKNRVIHYYDGTYYYLAVWDGSTWRKVQIA